MFVDASAVVAVIGDEPDANSLLAQLTAEDRRITSAVARWEAVAGLRKSYDYSPDTAITLVDAFIAAFSIELVSIGATESDLATWAYKT